MSVLNRETPTRAHTHVEAPYEPPPGPENPPEHTHPAPRIWPENQGDQRTNRQLKKARLRANIRITSQNVNGAAAPSENMNYREKWRSISHMMHTEKIAILTIQEAHLDQNMMEELGTSFEKKMNILISAHPDNP